MRALPPVPGTGAPPAWKDLAVRIHPTFSERRPIFAKKPCVKEGYRRAAGASGQPTWVGLFYGDAEGELEGGDAKEPLDELYGEYDDGAFAGALPPLLQDGELLHAGPGLLLWVLAVEAGPEAAALTEVHLWAARPSSAHELGAGHPDIARRAERMVTKGSAGRFLRVLAAGEAIVDTPEAMRVNSCTGSFRLDLVGSAAQVYAGEAPPQTEEAAIEQLRRHHFLATSLWEALAREAFAAIGVRQVDMVLTCAPSFVTAESAPLTEEFLGALRAPALQEAGVRVLEFPTFEACDKEVQRRAECIVM